MEGGNIEQQKAGRNLCRSFEILLPRKYFCNAGAAKRLNLSECLRRISVWLCFKEASWSHKAKKCCAVWQSFTASPTKTRNLINDPKSGYWRLRTSGSRYIVYWLYLRCRLILGKHCPFHHSSESSGLSSATEQEKFPETVNWIIFSKRDFLLQIITYLESIWRVYWC